MKTRIKIKNLGLGFVAVFLMLFSVAGYSQACPTNQITLSIQNMVQTSTTLDYDVVLTNTGPTTMKLSGYAGNVRFPAGMLTSGTLTVLTQPSATGNFPGIANVAPALVLASQQARWTNTPFAPEASSVDLPSGTPLRFARFRITNTGTPWDNFSAQLFFSTGAPPAGVSLNTVTVYCSGGTNSTPVSLAAGTLVLQNPNPIVLGESTPICFTSGVAVPTAPSCLGSADGSVTVTMSPLPSSSSASYSLNGGATVPVTLTAGAFTISGLVAGTYTLDVTGNGTCTTPVSVPFTIDAGAAPTVNSTSVSACDTYTWANNGQTYTASGTYTGNTTNCITEELVLTITPSSTNTTTASACDTYTWANNGQTYTASGTYTGTTTNCVTEELVLTITPSSTNTTTVSACDTYTWANNGQTYTTSGTYTGTTTNCVTEELVLTITPSSTNTSTVSACDTYTWANNGQTYTASGTYTGTTTNCVTEELVLTITPSSTNTTTVTECNAYTWANNGQTYTTSGTYTGTTTNCVTEELVLTITPGAFNTTTITACDTYTWANNGQTYTTSGTYTGTTTNCVTEQLVLTITPSSTNTTTASACDTYTWANNGQTYTASGTYTGTTTNCVTEQLVLTITPSSTNTTTVSACDTYTWAANGQTYTASGTYTGATVNCVTEELVLTINASPTTTDTVTACGSYTWAANGQTYTTSGTYTAVIPYNAAPAYCIPTTTNACDEVIGNVTFETINNNSLCDGDRYEDHTAFSANVVAGSSYPISVTNTGGSYPGDQVRVWADWNQDGDFLDAGEEYPMVYDVTTTGTIAVPAGAFNGSTRMRVRITYTGAIPSCGNVAWGETEDYTVNVSGGVAINTCDTNATLVLTINPTPAGDTLATAIPVSGLTYSTTGNNLASNCYTDNIGTIGSPDVFYMVTLENCAGTLTASTCSPSSDYDTRLRVYAADGTTLLANNDDFCGAQSTISGLDVSAHDVVYVVVEGFNATSQGNYGLDISQTIISTVPTFTQVDPICSGGSFTLATTSDNGITGTWAPAIDNTATTTYTFTPDAGQCTDPTLTTMTVVVTPSSTNTTTVSACDTYTWANNGQTYTTSGTYTGTTTNCVTEELVLTITPSSTNTSTVSACDSYTWANNGQTYTASGTYTGTTTNCVTEELVLTITPSSTNTTTASACDSYTWANNGQTYTTSGTYTGTTTNCVTEELVLTITPSSFNTTTATACDSYTWACKRTNVYYFWYVYWCYCKLCN